MEEKAMGFLSRKRAGNLLEAAKICDEQFLHNILKEWKEIKAEEENSLAFLYRSAFLKKARVCDSNGRSAIHWLAERNRGDVISVLVCAGVPVDEKTNEGNTPLHIAAECRHIKVVNLLLELGADKKVRNKEGYTPRDMCLKAGMKEYSTLVKKIT